PPRSSRRLAERPRREVQGVARARPRVLAAPDARGGTPAVAKRVDEATRVLAPRATQVALEPVVADSRKRGRDVRRGPSRGERGPDGGEVDARREGQRERPVEAAVQVDQARPAPGRSEQLELREPEPAEPAHARADSSSKLLVDGHGPRADARSDIWGPRPVSLLLEPGDDTSFSVDDHRVRDEPARDE